MSNAKEIRTKIASIKSTQKITKAMEMVSASKIRKAKERMFRSRPYAEKIRYMIGHIANSSSEYHHPYFDKREEKRVGLVVVTSDRGQCGSLNASVLRAAIKQMSDWRDAGIDVDLGLIGNKAQQFFRRIECNVIAKASQLGENPTLVDLIGSVKAMLNAYDEGKIDTLYIIQNRFVNTMTQKPEQLQLLPLEPVKDEEKIEAHWDYLYEPDAKELLDTLLRRYIESQVYQAVIENVACEHAARMVAMKAATDNAGQLIDDLQLMYNKARQAAITQELAEIVSGSAAV